MTLYKPALIQNHIQFAISQQNPYSWIPYTTQVINILRVLNKLGCIHKYYIFKVNTKNIIHYRIGLTVFMYKNTPFFKSFRLVSTPSKKYTISYKALRILQISLGASTLVLSTSLGIISHQEALLRQVGGNILFILS
jgi:ribosomal protein S8